MKNAPIMFPNRQKQSSRKLCGNGSGVDTMNSRSTTSLLGGANGCLSGRLALQYFTGPPGPLEATGLNKPLVWPPATADTAASPIPDCCSRVIACTTIDKFPNLLTYAKQQQ